MSTELTSRAEELAQKATALPEFRKMNLAGVKDKVAEILDLIGRTPGIFTTYTKHDISHINAMLRMLDWMVPPSTRGKMTPVDWLLVVLSIYFHDLGMFVPSAEYEGRTQNDEFVQFMEWLEKDTEAKDYLARAGAMKEEEREQFFYQEFVRQRHASRIREWITGQLSRHWGDGIKFIASEVGAILEALPTRFREHLALVCESHHKDDLNRVDIYPLFQKYGSLSDESANVQYAAMLLRTADLIHVTKDRTPTVMYKTINFSDLKSVDEWEKQKGAFSVGMVSREFDPDDHDTHVIQVSADLTEERPFFGLTEYIAWADSQIKQTKQWADKSQQSRDAKDFSFPWHSIQGDIRVAGNLPQRMRFELDRGRLLNLLVGHTIYNDATVAVRELLQNAIDAVRFQHYQAGRQARNERRAEPPIGRVLVNWDPETRVLVVEDDGTGMDLDVIKNNLLRVGASFYDTPQFQTENSDFSAISRFGIGILTCFMISDDIEIITCHEGQGRRIRMTSVHADYLLKDLPDGDPQLEGIEPHGTRVRLVLRPSVNLGQDSVLDIVRQWVILPACDVLYSEPGAEEQRVGFNSAAEALRYLFFKGRSTPTDSDNPYDIATVRMEREGGGSYELAYVVRRSFMSELLFTTSPNKQSGAVCIEGIRADIRLPGFSDGFAALLSAKGNRKFRTTVSRSNLEEDEQYFKVAEMCARALFGHVESEVKRISERPGRPLSQASTTGRWVFRSLSGPATSTQTRAELHRLYQDLPLIVVEDVQPDRSSTRNLRSLNEIAGMQEFWTIESRAVDYLGTISRDLGRELSISGFLGTLAPELLDVRVTPVVTDAHLFDDELGWAHSVAEVEFSKKHQRTLMRWVRRKQSAEPYNFAKIVKELFVEAQGVAQSVGLGQIFDFLGAEQVRWIRSYLSDSFPMVAQMAGDVSGVRGVQTRVGTVLSDDAEVAAVWGRILKAKRKLTPYEAHLKEHGALMLAGWVFSEAGTQSAISTYRRFDFKLPWRLLLPEVEEILHKVGVEADIPENLESLIGESSNWFDASRYWLNWDHYQSSE